MSDFGVEAELSVVVPQRELRSARQEVEDALADIPVGMSASGGGGGGATNEAREQRRRRREFRWARQRTDDIESQLEILENIEDELTEGGLSGGGGGGVLGLGGDLLSAGGEGAGIATDLGTSVIDLAAPAIGTLAGTVIGDLVTDDKSNDKKDSGEKNGSGGGGGPLKVKQPLSVTVNNSNRIPVETQLEGSASSNRSGGDSGSRPRGPGETVGKALDDTSRFIEDAIGLPEEGRVNPLQGFGRAADRANPFFGGLGQLPGQQGNDGFGGLTGDPDTSIFGGGSGNDKKKKNAGDDTPAPIRPTQPDWVPLGVKKPAWVPLKVKRGRGAGGGGLSGGFGGLTGNPNTSIIGGGLTGDPNTSIFGGGSGSSSRGDSAPNNMSVSTGNVNVTMNVDVQSAVQQAMEQIRREQERQRQELRRDLEGQINDLERQLSGGRGGGGGGASRSGVTR